MGNNQSRIDRKVQPSSPSYSDQTQKSLPLDMGNNQWMEQLRLEFDEVLKEYKSLGKKDTVLEKRIGEIKATMSKLEFMSHTPENKNTLEREIHGLKVAVSNLEPRPPLSEAEKKFAKFLKREIRIAEADLSKLKSAPPPSLMLADLSESESNKALKEEINSLKTRVMKLELLSQSAQDISEVMERNAELESRITELNSTVEQLESSFNVKMEGIRHGPSPGTVQMPRSQQPTPLMQYSMFAPTGPVYCYPVTVGHGLPYVSMPCVMIYAPPHDRAGILTPQISANERRRMLGENLYPLVEQLEPENARKVTGMLLELDRTEVLHLIESPEDLKERVAEAMEALRKTSSQQL